MEFLGKISVYFESKGYGFIQSVFYDTANMDMKFVRSLEKQNGIFFHIKDCSFDQIMEGRWVSYELQEYNGKTKAINVKNISLVEDIDYIINNWSSYSKNLKEKIQEELGNYYKYGIADCYFYQTISIYDESLQYEEKFEKLIHSGIRKKIVEIAKDFIAKNDSSTVNEDWYTFFSSIIEKELIGEFNFVQDCKKIIDESVYKVFSSEYQDVDARMSKVPSREELSTEVTSFLQNLKPSIKYTFTYEDGYWHTRWKWDGSEDSYISPKSSSVIECSLTHGPSFKGVPSFYWGYSGLGREYSRDEMSKEDICLEVYSCLQNSRRFWESLISVLKKREHEIVQKFVDVLYNSALSEVSQYFITLFPIYGKAMVDWSEEWKSKHCMHIGPSEIDSVLLYGSLSLGRYERTLERMDDDKYEKYHRPDIGGVNAVRLKAHLLDINLYLLKSIANVIDNKCASRIKLNVFDTEVIDKDGLILSADEKILYAIADPYKWEVIVPSSVTHIGDGAFVGCRNLKKVQFLGYITHIGHDVFRGVRPDIYGDFSQLSYIGYNMSSLEIVVNGESKTIAEWSYLYNKEIIDNTEITIKEVHIEHDDD